MSSAPHAGLLGQRSVALLLAHRRAGRTSIGALSSDAQIPYRTLSRQLRELRGYGAVNLTGHGSAGVEVSVRPISAWTTRGKLVLENQDLVLRLARWLKKRLPRWVPLDEHVANGQVGLLQAAERYNVFSEVPFTAFAHRRVRGAILDAYSGRRYEAELEGELPEGYEDRPDEAGLWEGALAGRRREVIEAALGDLPEKMAEACRTYMSEESLRDYGARVGLSESGACVRRQQALGLLREALERRGVSAESLL